MKLKILIFTFFICNELIAQTNHDSLLQCLNKSSNDTNKVVLLNALCWELRMTAPDKAMVYGNDAYNLAEKLNFTTGTIKALNNIGVAYHLQGNYGKAIENYSRGIKIAETNNLTRQKINLLSNIAGIYLFQSNYSKAIALYDSIEKVNRTLKDNKIEVAANNGMAYAYLGMAEYAKALSYYFKTLKINELENDQMGIAYTFLNIGNVYFYENKDDLAIEFYDKSLKIYTTFDEQNNIANVLSNIGAIHRRHNRLREAIDCFQKALQIQRTRNDRISESITLALVAEIYLENTKYSDALDYYQKSLTISEEYKDQEMISNRYHDIGSVYLSMNRVDLAQQLFEESLAIAQSIGAKENVKLCYNSLSDLFATKGDYKTALQYRNLSVQINDSIYSEATHKQIAELQTRYETEQKEQQIQLQQMQIERQQADAHRRGIILMAFIAGFVLTLVLAVVAARAYWFKKRANELLALKNAEINEQKEEIQTQAESLQVAYDEITQRKEEIEQKNKEITDSIFYARRIQQAMLPPADEIGKMFPSHFILFMPKNIVSGDFYWAKQYEDYQIIAAADCTGHGVPGAFMSMLGVAFLNQIIQNEVALHKPLYPDQILNQLRNQVIAALRQTGRDDETKDGMDIQLCIFHTKTGLLNFAGAYNPLYYFRHDALVEIKADRMPIGIHVKQNLRFTNNEIQLQAGDILYLFSDGYHDQFGGDEGLKFTSKRYKALLLDIHTKPLDEQRRILLHQHELWKGDEKQVDDIMVIGIKV